MKIFYAGFSKNRKGQLKIQQMAFVLVAMIIFFTMASLFYFSIRYASLQEDVEVLREEEVIETVRKISSTSEFAWTSEGDCVGCIDLDKVLILKERDSYKGFWKNIPLLQVARVYPAYGGIECSRENYPNCDTITLVEENKGFIGHKSFVALCRHDESIGTSKCELGKVIMAFEVIE